MRVITLFALSIIFSINIFAQDVITRKNPPQTINCKIIEVGQDLVHYSIIVGNEDRKFSIEKENIVSIQFENGETLNFEQKSYSNSNYGNNTNNIIKFNFFAPLYGYTYISYERLLKPSVSWEVGIGIIGLGWDINYNNPFGGVARAGFKFRKSPDYYSRFNEYTHLLKGVYIMPELVLTSYAYDDRVYSGTHSGNLFALTNYESVKTERVNTTSFAILITWGKEMIYADRFAVDWFGSVGYGFSDEHNDGLNYGFIGGDTKGFPLAFSAGIKIGLLFYDKKQPLRM